MNFTNLINSIQKNFSIFLLIILFLAVNNFFYNFYAIYKRDHNERMLISYGYCGGTSYGFIKEVKNKFLTNNLITIINFELNPPSIGLFYNLKKDKENKNLVLLNYNSNNKNILVKNKIDLKKYKLIFSSKNCMYYKKK